MRVERGVAIRLLHVGGRPVLVRAWEPGKDRVALRAEPLDPASIAAPGPGVGHPIAEAGEAELELALERMRFALGVDDDLGEFYRRFRGDPLLGPLLRRRPYLRPRRRPWPWEALAWAVVKQLIETGKAARIQRSLGVLGSANIVAGVALVAVNAVLAQVNHSHPAKKRALVRSNSPLWIGTAVTTAAAALDQARRRRA